MPCRIYFALLCKILSLVYLSDSPYPSTITVKNPILTARCNSCLSLCLYTHNMELFQELFFTVALSLLVSFILAKVFSMVSSCDVAESNSSFTPGTDVIQKAFLHEQKRGDKSSVCDSESERHFPIVEEAVGVGQHEEEEFRVENILSSGRESPVMCDDNEREVCREEEVAFVELKEEKASIGGKELEEKVVDGSSETSKFREIEINTENIAEEGHERSHEEREFREIEMELVKDGVCVAENEEVGVLERVDNKGDESDGLNNDGVVDERERLFDDWEGIERTELEKRFGAAVVFVGSKSNADRISSLEGDVKMQFYGLHKVAIEGTCHVPQPMAFKVSARAKWNAWQQLGNMSPEVAMEQYIMLLSRCIPGWMGDDTSGGGEQATQDAGTSENLSANLQKLVAEEERKSEKPKPAAEGPNSITKGKQ